MSQFLFYFFGAMAIAGAFATVLSRNPVYGAIFLIMTLFSIAGEFLILGSPFLAALQVLVYAGAIMVLYLFVIMLLNLGTSPDWLWWRNWRTYAGFVLTGIIAFVIITSLQGESPVAVAAYAGENVKEIATLLFSDPMMLFLMQALAVLLLMAVIGAIYLGRHLTDEEEAIIEARRATENRFIQPKPLTASSENADAVAEQNSDEEPSA